MNISSVISHPTIQRPVQANSPAAASKQAASQKPAGTDSDGDYDFGKGKNIDVKA